jgi:3-deoxy-D-manno-octulosonic-acid transferase
MFRALYDCLLIFIALVALPKFLIERIVKGKYRQNWKDKFGLVCSDFDVQNGDFVIWIHAVSMGETRAAIPLFQRFKKEYPHAKIFLSSTTETGQAEAKKSMPSASGFFFLPFDFSWNAKKLIQRLRPDVVVFIESDFWFNILSEAKSKGSLLFLANGKMSERSFQRFRRFSWASRKLFSLFDCLCVQSHRYAEHFSALGASHVHVTGNIKLDIPIQKLEDQEKKRWREDLGIQKDDPIVVVGSTHHPEEEQILRAFLPIWEQIPHLKVFIVPRHPERFASVAETIRQMGIPMLAYSQKDSKKGGERVFLIDKMGLLVQCYQMADLAIVAGSFTDKVGGHNIFEPIQVQTPVLFGPFMFTQMDLVDWILGAAAGRQIEMKELGETVKKLLMHRESLAELRENGSRLLLQVQGAIDRTWAHVNALIRKENEKKS